MRKSLLLAVLLATPGLVTAQPTQTDSKSPVKGKSPSSSAQESRGSALERARANQSDDQPDSVDEGTAPDVAKAGEDSSEPADKDADGDAPREPLAVKMFLTHDPASFVKAWKANASALPVTARISQGSPVMALVSVSGCEEGKDGKCAVVFATRTAGPDGQYDKPRTSPPWKPAPIRGKPLLAPASFGLRLGPGDPAGRYTIELKVTDTIAKTSRTVTASVMKPPAESGR